MIGLISWTLNWKFFFPQQISFDMRKTGSVKINSWQENSVDGDSPQRKTRRVSTVKNNIIIPSSSAVDEDLPFSLNFLGMADRYLNWRVGNKFNFVV